MAIGETGNTSKRLGLSLVDGADSAAVDRIKQPGQTAVRERTPGEVREALLDRVDLGLAKYINEELSPDRMLSDRASRVAELKAQYEAGTLAQPSAKDLATALARELDLDIGTILGRGGKEQE